MAGRRCRCGSPAPPVSGLFFPGRTARLADREHFPVCPRDGAGSSRETNTGVGTGECRAGHSPVAGGGVSGRQAGVGRPLLPGLGSRPWGWARSPRGRGTCRAGRNCPPVRPSSRGRVEGGEPLRVLSTAGPAAACRLRAPLFWGPTGFYRSVRRLLPSPSKQGGAGGCGAQRRCLERAPPRWQGQTWGCPAALGHCVMEGDPVGRARLPWPSSSSLPATSGAGASGGRKPTPQPPTLSSSGVHGRAICCRDREPVLPSRAAAAPVSALRNTRLTASAAALSGALVSSTSGTCGD